MTDRLDMHNLQPKLLKKSNITASLLVYLCIDDAYQNNIRYLEDHKCKVGQLKATLESQIQVDEEAANSFGYTQIVAEDMEMLMKYLGDYAKENVGQLPTFEEVLEKIMKANDVNSRQFEDVIFALKSSGYNPTEVKAYNKYKTISKHCVDLVNRAKNNRLDPLIGREPEVERMIEILAHYKKSNPLLVGEPGTGKTAVVEGLASAIAQGKVPDVLKGAKIYSTSVASLMAGTKFRGDVEEKMGQLLTELKKHEEELGVPTYLFIDEIHQIVGAGSNGNNDGSNLANIIKPELANGDLSLIGATTDKEYKRTIQKDGALDRRFQVVRVEEPSDEETIEIIRRGIAPVLTDYHGVKFSKAVIERAVRLSSKYITDKAQPDKAISIIDSIGARLRTTESRTNSKVTDVERLIATITGTPVSAFQELTKENSYVDIETELNKVVFGQSEAVTKIAQIYERSKAGLNEEGQPIGSVLAVGPTGTGKTEVAKSLAKLTKSKFYKIDMSEYNEKHSVAKLFGAPPGYKGHGEGGQLTNFIRKNPHTILLLDEIEKAHKAVFDALLGIIDGAAMTDGEGNKVDFSNVMIIMTSNAGAASAANKKRGIDLAGNSNPLDMLKSEVSKAALQATFSPEFRNKLSAIINFKNLGTDEVRMVTDKFLQIAKDKVLSKKGVSIEFTEEVYGYISEKGFSVEFGARPVKRLIDEKVIDSLVKPLLKGEVVKGDELIFSVDESGEVVYSKKEEQVMEV